MKKLSIACIFLLLILCACSSNHSSTDSKTHLPIDSDLESADSFDHEYQDTAKSTFIDFDSIDDLVSALKAEPSKDKMSSLYSIQNYKGDILSMGSLYIPKYNNENLTFKNKSGYTDISIELNSAYGMHLIWYRPKLDLVNMIIVTGTIPDSQIKQMENISITSLKAVHSKLLTSAPAPNIVSSSPNVTTKNVLINGQNIPAVFTQYANDPRYHIEFLLNEMTYVKIYIFPEDYEAGILNNLSFDALQVTTE